MQALPSIKRSLIATMSARPSRKEQAEAAERRVREQEGRGVRDPEKLRRRQQRSDQESIEEKQRREMEYLKTRYLPFLEFLRGEQAGHTSGETNRSSGSSGRRRSDVREVEKTKRNPTKLEEREKRHGEREIESRRRDASIDIPTKSYFEKFLNSKCDHSSNANSCDCESSGRVLDVREAKALEKMKKKQSKVEEREKQVRDKQRERRRGDVSIQNVHDLKETRRRQQAEAAEKRLKEQEGRGVKDPERIKRMQQKAEELEKREREAQNNDGPLRWQMN